MAEGNEQGEGWRLGEIMVVAGISIASAIVVFLITDALANRNQ